MAGESLEGDGVLRSTREENEYLEGSEMRGAQKIRTLNMGHQWRWRGMISFQSVFISTVHLYGC